MTGAEFLRKQRRITIWWLAGYAIIAFIGVGIFAIAVFTAIKAQQPKVAEARMVILMIALVVTALVVLACERLHVRLFKRRHDEMWYLKGWMACGRSAESYPTTVEEKQAFAPEAEMVLSQLGYTTNIMIGLRDGVIKTGSAMDKASPKGIAHATVAAIMNDAVDTWNRRYVGHWRLFVDKLQIIAGSRYGTSKEFRESLP